MKKIIIATAIFFCLNNLFSIENKEVRIVSLSPAITKDIFHLKLDKYLVGVTDYCIFGDQLENMVKSGKVKRVSGYSNFNYELIMSVKPTYILCMDSTTIEQFKMLKKIAGCKIYTFMHPKNIKDIEKQILDISKIFKKENDALKIIGETDKRLAELEKKVSKISNKKKPKVLVEIYFPPYTTCGKNTFIYDIIVRAGGKPCFELEKDWENVSIENIMEADPDFIVKTHLADVNKTLLSIKAYKENRIFIPKDNDDFLQPGLQNIDAIFELFNYIEKNYYGK